jgi:signal transduction histidine kinase
VSGERADIRELIDRAIGEERNRIARDLHDLVIQRLFAIGLGLQAFNRNMVEPEREEQLRGFVTDIDQTIRDIRRSIFYLKQRPNSPPSLRAEILRVISEASRTIGFEPTVRLSGPLDSVVPAHVHLDLIATLREALSNVARHAGARRVWVTVTADLDAGRLELLVKDDGQGLPMRRPLRGGLANINERAARLGGHCHVYSPEDCGTRVFWAVPLAPGVLTMTGAEPVEATS